MDSGNTIEAGRPGEIKRIRFAIHITTIALLFSMSITLLIFSTGAETHRYIRYPATIGGSLFAAAVSMCWQAGYLSNISFQFEGRNKLYETKDVFLHFQIFGITMFYSLAFLVIPWVMISSGGDVVPGYIFAGLIVMLMLFNIWAHFPILIRIIKG